MLALTHVDPGCVLGHTPDCMIGVWRSGLTLERFNAMLQLGKAATTAKGGKIASLSVVVQLPGGMDAQSRELAKDLTHQMAPYSLCGAQVLEGTGLWMATVRLIVTTVQLAAGNRVPSKVFEHVHDAVAWLRTQDQIDVDAIHTAVNDLRSELVRQPLPNAGPR